MAQTTKKQQGASPVVLLIILAIIGVGVFIGIQYIPQKMERGSVDTILSNIEKDHVSTPFSSKQEIESQIANKLNIEGMNDMLDNFTVKEEENGFVIKAKYDRELNLIYTKKPVTYEKTIILQ